MTSSKCIWLSTGRVCVPTGKQWAWRRSSRKVKKRTRKTGPKINDCNLSDWRPLFISLKIRCHAKNDKHDNFIVIVPYNFILIDHP
jgi:hypothetical protein